MKVADMHYDFKKKLNKVDSQQHRNLLIPEIDWVLNEAQMLFINMIAQPRNHGVGGFEKSLRNTHDLQSLVRVKDLAKLGTLPQDQGLLKEYYHWIVLPDDYLYFISAKAKTEKKGCKDRWATIYIRQHDDEFEKSPFDQSSFEWRTVNATFETLTLDDKPDKKRKYVNSLKLYTDGTFVVNSANITYLKEPRRIYFADGLSTKEYKLPSGELLKGSSDCELPEHTHSAIVDLAVQITSGELGLPTYQIHSQKLKINQTL